MNNLETVSEKDLIKVLGSLLDKEERITNTIPPGNKRFLKQAHDYSKTYNKLTEKYIAAIKKHLGVVWQQLAVKGFMDHL